MGKLLGILLLLAVIGGAAAGGGWFWLDGLYTSAGPATADGKSRVVIIERGAATQAIATKLAESGAIADEGQFRLVLRARELMGDKPVMKAGEYEIPSGASMSDIVAELSTGAALQYAVIVPEGLTSDMIVKLLAEREWKATGGAERVYKLAGDLPEVPPEGVLLPGDYAVTRGDTVASVIDRMKKAQAALLAEIWPARKEGLPLKTQQEAVILASVIEKESGNADEQPLIAAAFLNRLRTGMRLQADATIVYGITKGYPIGRTITSKELATRNAWNTYQMDGLPETPICNPGAGALRAALQPADSKAIYFMADGKGGHLFSETYAEHQRNVDAYWKLRRENAAAGVNTPAVRQQ
ncbi:MAG: hypothetical protein RIR33_998 [Pseudomonadota bacterium]